MLMCGNPPPPSGLLKPQLPGAVYVCCGQNSGGSASGHRCGVTFALVALPSSESWFSLVSCSICRHQPSMRAVSACSSFRNQWPSLLHSVPPLPNWGRLLLLLLLPFPLSSHGSGGGRDEGSRAGSRLSEKEDELLRVVERLRICLGAGGGEDASPGALSPLSTESCRGGGGLVDWLALLTMTFFSDCLTWLLKRAGGVLWASESASGFEVMLLEPLGLKQGEK